MLKSIFAEKYFKISFADFVLPSTFSDKFVFSENVKRPFNAGKQAVSSIRQGICRVIVPFHLFGNGGWGGGGGGGLGGFLVIGKKKKKKKMREKISKLGKRVLFIIFPIL